jgi:peptidoglycan/xylan/chitin deacetylase (PgdA/CDA1 family)
LRSRLRSFGRIFLIALVIALAFPLVTAERTFDLVPPIGVLVRGHDEFVPPGTTFGQAVRRFGLHARDGALLDVEGEVLDAAKFPGALLLNGGPAQPGDVLHEHDTIKVVHGEDRTETKVRTVEEVPGGMVSNPQFMLGTTPGEQIVVKGRVSGKIVSTTFHATGPSQVPDAVALTFDDGPSPRYTPEILSILQERGVQATFFTIGFEAHDYSYLIEAERDAGMTIGNHTWDHPEVPPFRDLPEERIRDEMERTTEALHESGVDPYLFRPPGGTYGDTELAIAAELGMRVVLWSVDPEDWRNDVKAKQIVKNVLSNVHAGSIVLMHDGGGFQDATVKALPKIIDGIRAMGLHLVPLLR